MDRYKIFSRRNVESKTKVDFRPDDPGGTSPFAQLRRLNSYLEKDVPPANDITDCDEALAALRELTYRKIFTGTSHEEFMELDAKEPTAVDWLIAVHAIDASNFQSKRSR